MAALSEVPTTTGLPTPTGLVADLEVDRGTFHLRATVEVIDGGVTAILGPNGSGKTTALEALAGLSPLSGGRIDVAGAAAYRGPSGRPLTWADAARGVHWPPQARRVGLVLAEHLLFPQLSLRENVAFGPRSRGASRVAARGRADAELDRVGLADLAERRPGQVSSGQAQRAALARALATDPDLLLLDEPLSALDPQTRSVTRAELAHRLAGFPGMTVLVTHDPLDALTLADRLVFFDSGGVVQSGSPAEVVTRPRNPYVASVVGLNLLRGRAVTTESVMVRVGGGAMEVVTAEDPALVPSGTDLWVTLNPAAISLYAGQPHGSPRNTWPVTVAEVTLTGQRARVALQGPVPLMAEVTAPAVVSLGIAPGRSFWASVKATEVTAYPA